MRCEHLKSSDGNRLNAAAFFGLRGNSSSHIELLWVFYFILIFYSFGWLLFLSGNLSIFWCLFHVDRMVRMKAGLYSNSRMVYSLHLYMNERIFFRTVANRTENVVLKVGIHLLQWLKENRLANSSFVWIHWANTMRGKSRR